MPERNENITIIGAGIAGLSAALFLAKSGHSVTIYERTKKAQEIGAGLQISPNVTKIFKHWELLEACKDYAFEPTYINLIDGKNGNSLLELPIKHFSQKIYEAPYLTFHRADLQNFLLEKVKTFSNIILKYNTTIEDYVIEKDKIKINVSENSSSKTYYTNFLLACDGVWSTIRKKYLPDNEARFTGYVAWRATVSRESLPKNINFGQKSVNAWLGPNNHIVTYPIKNGEEHNIVAITPAEDQLLPRHHITNSILLFKYFKNWSKKTESLLNLTKEWTYWPLFEMENILLTADDHVFFLGDSAHAMLPFAAQGAAMAIEDAACFAIIYNKYYKEPRKLAQYYQAIRSERLLRVKKRGKFNSFIYHQKGLTAIMRNIFMQIQPADKFLKGLDWLYNYDIIKEAHKKLSS